MSEQAFWRSIENQLKRRRDRLFQRTGCDDEIAWQRFEDKFGHGIPDLNICEGGKEIWIELKQLDEWPKRDTTRVKCGLRIDQAQWLVRRIKAGGFACLMVKVGRDVFIFRRHFHLLVDGVPRKDFIAFAAYHGYNIRDALAALLSN